MEMDRQENGFSLSDISIAAGLLCALRVDETNTPLKDENDRVISAFAYGGLQHRKRGSGYLFVILGNSNLIQQRINDWFEGKAHDDLRAFSEKAKFLKQEIFDDGRRGKALEQGEGQKGRLENDNDTEPRAAAG